MVQITGLVWDDWNKDHIAKHRITVEEIEEVCHGKHEAKVSYRKRILLIGKTRAGRLLAIALSPENKNLEPYSKGMYYIVTAFEKEVEP